MFRLTISKVFIVVLAAIASYSGANAAVEEALATANEAVNNAMGTSNEAVNNAMGTANDAVSNAMDFVSNLKDTNETDTEADTIMDEIEADESSSAAYGMLAGAVFSVLATVVSL